MLRRGSSLLSAARLSLVYGAAPAVGFRSPAIAPSNVDLPELERLSKPTIWFCRINIAEHKQIRARARLEHVFHALRVGCNNISPRPTPLATDDEANVADTSALKNVWLKRRQKQRCEQTGVSGRFVRRDDQAGSRGIGHAEKNVSG